MLSQAGYAVTCADDGFAGLDLLDRYPFDLLILDIMMKKMNGIEMLKRMRANPALKTLPVLMLSARADKRTITLAATLGAMDYMVKPPERDQILHKIETILGSRPRFAEVDISENSSKSLGALNVQVRLVSIGESGMCFFSPTPLPQGTKQRIQSPLFQEIGIESPQMHVVFCQKDEDQYLIFVNFIGMNPATVAKIREWVINAAFKGRVVA